MGASDPMPARLDPAALAWAQDQLRAAVEEFYDDPTEALAQESSAPDHGALLAAVAAGLGVDLPAYVRSATSRFEQRRVESLHAQAVPPAATGPAGTLRPAVPAWAQDRLRAAADVYRDPSAAWGDRGFRPHAYLERLRRVADAVGVDLDRVVRAVVADQDRARMGRILADEAR